MKQIYYTVFKTTLISQLYGQIPNMVIYTNLQWRTLVTGRGCFLTGTESSILASGSQLHLQTHHLVAILHCYSIQQDFLLDLFYQNSLENKIQLRLDALFQF